MVTLGYISMDGFTFCHIRLRRDCICLIQHHVTGNAMRIMLIWHLYLQMTWCVRIVKCNREQSLNHAA